MDQSTQAGVSTPLQVLHPISGSSETESQVDIRADQGIVEPQSPTQVIEPHTESNIPQQSTSRPKLQVRRKRSDKVGTVSEPTALPPLKKRKTFREATVSPSVSSQQDMDFDMANEQYLGHSLNRMILLKFAIGPWHLVKSPTHLHFFKFHMIFL